MSFAFADGRGSGYTGPSSRFAASCCRSGSWKPLAYFFPKTANVYAIRGLYDVSRNRGLNAETLRRYFLGNGVLTPDTFAGQQCSICCPCRSSTAASIASMTCRRRTRTRSSNCSRRCAMPTRSAGRRTRQGKCAHHDFLPLVRRQHRHVSQRARVPSEVEAHRDDRRLDLQRQVSTSKHFRLHPRPLRLLANPQRYRRFRIYRCRRHDPLLAQREALHLRRHIAASVDQ